MSTARERPRLGILTLTQSENFGTVLQAYATRRIFAALLTEESQLSVVKTDVGAVRLRRIASILNPLNPSSGLIRAQNFIGMRKFARTSVVGQGPYVNIENRARTTAMLNHNFDGLVTGSDEIWNLAFVGGESVYFVPSEFQGYRASFATSANRIELDRLGSREIDILTQSLEKYSIISVRDQNTRHLVESLAPHSTVHEVLDPTLLLEPLFDPIAPSRRHRRGILLMMRDRAVGEQLIEDFASQTAIDSVFSHYPGTRRVRASPAEFSRMFGDYDCIVTDFFHGTCMAVRCGSYFISVDSEPVYASYESKIANLLRKLNLTGHYVNLGTEGRAAGYERVRGLVAQRIGGSAEMPDFSQVLTSEREKGLRVASAIAEDFSAKVQSE